RPPPALRPTRPTTYSSSTRLPGQCCCARTRTASGENIGAEAPAPPGAGTGRADPDHPTVTVRRGDCLWHLAAAELGPDATPREIDARWRRWYEANRRVIGDDPHLLLPGTVLTSPVFAPHAGVDGPRP
ncbi:LysM peptidoglycan-binding domain-containing protein, partial [Micrococcus luteus]|uniref:LysM peptidoglycan-binding domain-containing protein n=1 Tax=Micrococcus luteus TaxID=1270 RepID=UPI000B3136E9